MYNNDSWLQLQTYSLNWITFAQCMVGDILILDKLWRWIKGLEGGMEGRREGEKHISEGHK